MKRFFNTLGHLSPCRRVHYVSWQISPLENSGGRSRSWDFDRYLCRSNLGLDFTENVLWKLAGKAMAFKKDHGTIRILIVLAAGMGTSMFFWTLYRMPSALGTLWNW